MRDSFIDTVMEMAQYNPNICVVTGDLGFGVLTRFQERFPNQFVNAGIAEQNMTGLATGLALVGKTVFTYSIGNFPTLRCLEQIRNDACYHDANVKIVCIGGGFSYGALGVSHHATEDLSIMRAIPGLTCVVPADKWEAAEATKAIAQMDGTCYFRLDKSNAPDTHQPGEQFRLGKARIIRKGSDFTLIACGGIVGEALKAAELLGDSGISCRVISMHTIKPFDSEAVFDACRETGGIVTIEESNVDGGLGSAVAEVCLESGILPEAFKRIGLRGGFTCAVGSQNYLREYKHINADAIFQEARNLLAGA